MSASGDATSATMESGVESRGRDDEIIIMQSLCDACRAAQNHQNDTTAIISSRVATILGCRRRSGAPSLDGALLSSTPQADIVMDRLFAAHQAKDDESLSLLLNDQPDDDDDDDDEKKKKKMAKSNERMQRAQELIRALLISPSIYDTPWKAACRCVARLTGNNNGASPSQSFSSSVSADDALLQRSTIVEIQTFLTETVAYWWEEERRIVNSQSSSSSGGKPQRQLRPANGETLSSHTPRKWLIELLLAVIGPLRRHRSDTATVDQTPGDGNDSCSQVQSSLFLDLVPTIVTLARDVDASLFTSCMDHLFQQPIMPGYMMQWVRLATELRMFLREKDWDTVRSALVDALSQSDVNKAFSNGLDDLVVLAGEVCTLCTTVINKKEGKNEISKAQQWTGLVFQLLNVASVDLSTYSAVEAAFLSQFTALPLAALQSWTSAIAVTTPPNPSDNNDIPNWIQANTLLMLVRASQKAGSQLVSGLIAQSVGECRGGIDVSNVCRKRILYLTGPSPQPTMVKRPKINQKEKFELFHDDLHHRFDGVSYAGQGRFVDSKGFDIPSFTPAGKIVYQSLSLDSQQTTTMTASDQVHLMGRAEAWMHIANESLTTLQGSDLLELAVAVLCFVVVYCEVRTSRTKILGTMRQFFTSTGADPGKSSHDISMAFAQVLAIVVQTIREAKMQYPEIGDFSETADFFSNPVSVPLCIRLTRILSPLPSAREKLLTAAQSCLHSFSKENELWTNEEPGVPAVEENCDRIQCGLSSLIYIICASDWDSYSSRAWAELSNVIAGSTPPLPFALRSWLSLTLHQAVSENRLPPELCERVLCACLVRVLAEFTHTRELGRCRLFMEQSWPRESTVADTPTKQEEDLINLFELILCIHNFILDKGGQEKRRDNVLFCGKVLTFLGTDEKSRAKSTEDTFPLLVLDDNHGTSAAATFVFLLVVERLMDVSVFGDSLPSHDDAVAWLVAAESKKFNDYQHEPPIWLEAKPREADDESISHAESLTIPLCDGLHHIALDFLIGRGGLPGQESAGIELNPVALGLSALAAAKRRHHNNSDCLQSNLTKLEATTTRSLKAFPTFCNIMIPTIKDSIAKSCCLNQIDGLIHSLLDICRAVQPAQAVLDDPVLSETIIKHLLDVYNSLSREDAVVALIAFLEAKAFSKSENGPPPGKKCGTLLSYLKDSDHIDGAVHEIRLDAVQTIRRYFTFLGQDQAADKDIDYGSSRAVLSGRSRELVIRFVEVLALDIQSGLKGDSGGLSCDLYLAYVECLSACVNLLWGAANQSSEEQRKSMISTCDQAATILEGVLCSYSLTGSMAFTRTVMLPLYELPAIARDAFRWLCVKGDGEAVSEGADSTEAFSIRSFKQSCRILEREFCKGDSYTAWKHIAGHAAVAGGSVDEMSCDDGSGVDDDAAKSAAVIPTVVFVPDDPSSNVDLSCGVIQLRNKNLWSAAISSNLQAFELTWRESLRVIQEQSTDIVFQSEAGKRAYFSSRQSELEDILSVVSTAFKLSVPSDTKKSSSIEFPHVVALPEKAKGRMFALFDRVLLLIQKALKLITAQIGGQRLTDGAGTSHLAFVEALSCVSAWLSCVPEKSDFSAGVHRWYSAERRRFGGRPQALESFAASKPAILRRLPKLLIRIKESESAFRKLLLQLDAVKSGSGRGQRQLVRRIDDLVAASACKPSSSSPRQKNNNAGLFRRLVSSKLRCLENLDLEMDAGDSDDESAGEAGRQNRKRKAEQGAIQRRLKEERRRYVIRSRNQLVDKWLQLDQEIENAEDDAFADLEDFLVDG